MSITQTLRQFLPLGLLAAAVLSLFIFAPAYAASCGGTETSIIDCKQDNSSDKLEDNGVWGLLLLGLNIMIAGVGIVAVGGIIYAAILYATAADKADQVTQAKTIITNVVIGLVAFALMYTATNFLIPGGVFTT